MKKCTKCNKKKEQSEFYSRSNRPGKIMSYCKSCFNTTQHKRQIDIKKRSVEYLGGNCKLCGYSKSYAALQFHHRDPAQKEVTISKIRSRSFERIREELDKCDLLCSNCHAEIHASY